MIASRPSSILGSGTVSQRMSPLPCHASAFIASFSVGCREMKDARWKLVPHRTFGKNAAEQDKAAAVINFESTDVERNPVMSASRPFAIVTGASTGIGLELAKCC